MMFKHSTFSRLPAIAGTVIIFATGIPAAVAADQDKDPQTQAAHLLQHPQQWSSRMDEVLHAGRGASQMVDAQEQARRSLQPVIDILHGTTAKDQFVASSALDPQTRAARLLNPQAY